MARQGAAGQGKAHGKARGVARMEISRRGPDRLNPLAGIRQVQVQGWYGPNPYRASWVNLVIPV